MKKHLALILLGALFFTGRLSAQEPFTLNTANEIIQISGSVSLTGSAILCDKVFHIKENNYEIWTEDYSTISYMEQCLMVPYSKALHYTGTGTAALALLSPALMLLTPNDQWLTIGVMYAETLLWAYGIKEWGKLLVNRARPYMYFEGYPQDKVEDGDWNCSFPSGHTTLAFAGAAFTTYLFNQYFPESSWKFAVAGVSFGIAATTGALRIASGNHFLTDVLTGALIGTICGLAVPFMHTTTFYNSFHKKNKTELTLSPLGFSAKVNF
ncbi:MAG: phosphatase PAP2 family protein [Treponema sp.]|nr:phosphatase PAP2 family protein [Treponema sp.]